MMWLEAFGKFAMNSMTCNVIRDVECFHEQHGMCSETCGIFAMNSMTCNVVRDV